MASFRAARILAAVFAAALPAAGQAAMVEVSFTGTVLPGSYDLAGTIYGQGVSGQIGDTISGSYLINTALLTDIVANPNIGQWGTWNGIFPQPANAMTGQYTIDGVTVPTSQHMGVPNAHSGESGVVYDLFPSVSTVDRLTLYEGSDLLVCGNVNDPQTCSGGSYATSFISLDISGAVDFLANKTLEQSFSLDAAAIADLVSAGGAAGGEYRHWRTLDGPPFTPHYDARGTFTLTSLRFAPLDEVTTPEPMSAALLGFGLLGLLAARRGIVSRGIVSRG